MLQHKIDVFFWFESLSDKRNGKINKLVALVSVVRPQGSIISRVTHGIHTFPDLTTFLIQLIEFFLLHFKSVFKNKKNSPQLTHCYRTKQFSTKWLDTKCLQWSKITINSSVCPLYSRCWAVLSANSSILIGHKVKWKQYRLAETFMASAARRSGTSATFDKFGSYFKITDYWSTAMFLNKESYNWGSWLVKNQKELLELDSCKTDQQIHGSICLRSQWSNWKEILVPQRHFSISI